MPRPKGAKNKPKGAPVRPVRPRKVNNMGRGAPRGQAQTPRLTVKQVLEATFERVGGLDWLVQVATENPIEFLKLWAKMLPLEIQVAQVQPVTVEVSLHEKAPLVLDNDTGLEIVPENAGLYSDYPGVVSRD